MRTISKSNESPKKKSLESFGITAKQYQWFKQHPKLLIKQIFRKAISNNAIWFIVLGIIILLLDFIWGLLYVVLVLPIIYCILVSASFDTYEEYLLEFNKEVEEFRQKEQQREEEKERLLKEKECLIKAFANNTQEQQTILNSISNSLKTIRIPKPLSRDYWQSITWQKFEEEVMNLYTRLGYHARLTKKGSDGGIDIIISKQGIEEYIQCKHYKDTNNLGVKEVKEFYATCQSDEKKGIMVCLSNLTNDAKHYYAKENVNEVISIIGLDELMRLDKQCCPCEKRNSELIWNNTFNSFILENGFIDCDYSWVFPRLFTSKDEAMHLIYQLTSWKGMKYCIHSYFLDRIGECFYILLHYDTYTDTIQKATLSLERDSRSLSI